MKKRKTKKSDPADSQWIAIASAMAANTSKMIEVNQRIIERLDLVDSGLDKIRARLSGEESVTCFVWGIIRVETEIRLHGFPIEGVPVEAVKKIVELNIAAAPQKMCANEEKLFQIDPMMNGLSGALYIEGPFAFVDVQVGRNSAFASSSPSYDGDPPAAKSVVFGAVHVGQRIQARVRRIDP